MALGNTYNNDKSSEVKKIAVYSNYKLANNESTIDKTCLSFDYWNGLLKISIAPKLTDKDDDFSFDYKNAATVYLSHQKARLFYNEIIAFKNDSKILNAGIPAGSGIIQIANAKEYGGSATGTVIVIKSVDDNGKSNGTFIYECKDNYYYGIRNYNDKKDVVFDKNFYNGLEVDMIKDVLKTYYEAMTGAQGYAAADAYDVTHLKNSRMLSEIAEKLGVSTGNSGNGGKSSNSSFFNNSGNSSPSANKSFNNASLDSLIGDIEND